MNKFFELIKLHGKRIEVEKQGLVFRQGEQDTHLYFIESGLLKAFYHSEDGKVFIKSFLQQGDVIGSLTAAYNHQSCSFNLQCLQDCRLYKIPFSLLLSFTKQDIQLANEMILLLLNFSMKKEKREYEFLCLDAPTRYQQLMQTHPTLANNVTQTDIAGYLGITNVALSRIKKRLTDAL